MLVELLQDPFIHQCIEAGLIVLSAGTGVWITHRQARSTVELMHAEIASANQASQPGTTSLAPFAKEKRVYLLEIRYWALRALQAGLGVGALLLAARLFPATERIEHILFNVSRLPALFLVIGGATYFVIRAGVLLVDLINDAAVKSPIVRGQDTSGRFAIRIATLAGAARSGVVVISVAVGTTIALSTAGIDVFPLLAGAGLVGIVLSLASQNVLREMISGLCILLEDQYSINDRVTIGEWTGVVEDLDLRITKLRDDRGRLITIPNSEVRSVANLSKEWGRADIVFTIAPGQDIEAALSVAERVGQEIEADPILQKVILEPPVVLGVEALGQNGVTMRVWIKTQPLEHEGVAREYRRHLARALSEAKITF